MKCFLLVLIPGWLTYTDPANHFTMQYPKDWAQMANGNAVLFVSPKSGANDQFRENVNLIVQDLSSQPMDLAQYTALSKKQISDAYGNDAAVGQGSTTIAGQKCNYLTYNMRYKSEKLRVTSYWFVKDKTAYLFTYTAEPTQVIRYAKIATDIINSFAFSRN